ncbi:uncharacterized protein LOC132898907 [Neoarius graeffei]|uniref:uncharacterized protein LOC132898907 n=1 Tax=Neoarius graeffei TaxID=443677 RepID=UPI00298BD3B7|nr:uncharacterized protein LOC132898907 [Neoarius graeffei]
MTGSAHLIEHDQFCQEEWSYIQPEFCQKLVDCYQERLVRVKLVTAPYLRRESESRGSSLSTTRWLMCVRNAEKLNKGEFVKSVLSCRPSVLHPPTWTATVVLKPGTRAQKTTAPETSGWPVEQRAARLLPLLTGEAQLAALQLPADHRLAYVDLRRAVLQRVGHTPEQQHQRFHALRLEEVGRPFAFGQQLRDACWQWLRDDSCDAEGLIDQVVLQQFVTHLPAGTAEWVQYHRPASLDQAIELVEDHLAAVPAAGQQMASSLLSSSLSLSLSPSSCVPSSPRSPTAEAGAGTTPAGPLHPWCPPVSPFCVCLSSTSGECAPDHRCRGKAWAGLLALRGAGPPSTAVHGDRGGRSGSDPRCARGRPRSGRSVSHTDGCVGQRAGGRFVPAGGGGGSPRLVH